MDAVLARSDSRPADNPISWIGFNGTMHEVCRFDFFVNDEHYGSLEIDGAEVGIYSRWRSTAYFCCACGDVWGRVVQHREKTGIASFWPVPRACEKHSDQWGISGSLLDSDFESFIPLLPEALAAREAILHINYYYTTGDNLE